MANIQELEFSDDFKDNSDLNVVSFIFAQGEKTLQNTIRIADNITDRAYRLLTILLPITIPVVVGLFQKDNFIFYTAVCAFAFLGLSTFFCALVIFSYNFKAPSQHIENLINPQLFKNYDPTQKELSYKFYLIWALKQIHFNTKFNRTQNKIRLKYCDGAVITALSSLLSPIIAKIILFSLV